MQKFILCLRSSLIENWIMSQMFPMFFFPNTKELIYNQIILTFDITEVIVRKSKAYNIGLLRYRDLKIRVCGKDLIPSQRIIKQKHTYLTR